MKPEFSKPAKLFLIATLLYGVAFSFWELFFNLYFLASGFDKDYLGLIKAISPMSSLLLGLPLGKVADRIGHKNALFFGLSVGLMGMLLQVTFTSPILIIMMGVVQGAGFMLYRISASPFIMKVSNDNNRTMLFSLNFSLTTFAGMVGNLVAGQLPGLASSLLNTPANSALSYQLVIISGIILGATCLVPLFLIKKFDFEDDEDHQEATPNPINSIRSLFSLKIIQQLFIINSLVGLGAALLIPYFNVFFREVHDMSDKSLGLLYSISSLLVMIGSLSAPWLARVLKSKIVATNLTQLLSIGFLLLAGFSPLLWLAQIGFLLRTVLMQLSSPLLENFAMEVSPPGREGTIAGIRSMGWQIGQTIGLLVSGLVQSRFGFSPIFIITASLYFLSIVLAWLYFRPMEKAAASATA